MSTDSFLPLLKLPAEEIKEKVIVCGDPERAEKIAKKLDGFEEISYNREYRVFNGSKAGVELTVASHGVGGPGAAVCFEELIRGGARKIIRVGTAGSLNPDIKDGDIVIASAAIRKDGVSEQLIPLSYPAVASTGLINALESSAKKMGQKTYTGIILTIAAFYPELLGLPNNQFSKANALAVEMEVSALFVIASLNGVEAGAIVAIDGLAVDFDADAYNPHRNLVDDAIERESEIAIDSLI